jgi:hypothetical protein
MNRPITIGVPVRTFRSQNRNGRLSVIGVIDGTGAGRPMMKPVAAAARAPLSSTSIVAVCTTSPTERRESGSREIPSRFAPASNARAIPRAWSADVSDVGGSEARKRGIDTITLPRASESIQVERRVDLVEVARCRGDDEQRVLFVGAR